MLHLGESRIQKETLKTKKKNSHPVLQPHLSGGVKQTYELWCNRFESKTKTSFDRRLGLRYALCELISNMQSILNIL